MMLKPSDIRKKKYAISQGCIHQNINPSLHSMPAGLHICLVLFEHNSLEFSFQF